MDGLGPQFQPWREAYKISQPIGFAPDDGGYQLGASTGSGGVAFGDSV